MSRVERKIMIYEMIVDYLEDNEFDPGECDFAEYINDLIDLIYLVSEDVLREVYNDGN